MPLPLISAREGGVSVRLVEDLRWGRCDIKSIALLANVLANEEAVRAGDDEAVFVDIRTAWIVGVVLDVAYGSLLGQHALALCVIVYITVKFHLLMRVFPLSQLTATVFALLALYQFLLFWINGVAGVTAPAIDYWGPVVAGTIVWPFLSILLSGLRYRVQTGG